ncbi:MAG: ammonium transporter [Peptococcaceae bacterium]|nr:ammonium transporter [Peptococcaceae bacterium]
MTIDTIVNEMTGFWTFLCLMLVFFMQCGFTMVEAGLTRAKNAGNIIMKNMMDFCIGTIAFMALGFGLICGPSVNGLFGGYEFVFSDFQSFDWSAFFFNLVFCATAATIVSGAMAERTKFSAYCAYSFIISLLIYPVEAHWIWNAGGWLYNLGFVDFAGSTAVHMTGGVAALIGAAILGPRIGKYKKLDDGSVRVSAIPGHSMTLAALGVFILWFAWYGFNGAAAKTTSDAAQILVTTTISAAIATTTTMFFTWKKNGAPDVSMTLNGSLAGLVGITAGCANVDALGATVIGFICGLVVVLAVEGIDQRLHIDDPVGAVAVHGCCGAIGTLLVGVFDYNNGLLYGGGVHLLLIQILGVCSVICWVAVTMTVVYKVIDATIGLRVSRDEEIEGLDACEHNLASSYADFMFTSYPLAAGDDSTATIPTPEAAVPVAIKQGPQTIVTDADGHVYTKVQIITNENRFDDLKKALGQIGVAGMTVTHVLGCGTQKGKGRTYRGVEIDYDLMPKIQIDIVVSKVPVDAVIDAARHALYTGKIGDGKIFVYNVGDVVRIRTGETGYDALQIQD